MKRIFLMAAMVLGSYAAMAQELTDAQKAAQEAAVQIAQTAPTQVKAPKPRYWTNSLLTQINFGQTSLTNWAAGGYNSVTVAAFIDGNANYAKNNVFVNNRLQLDYGFIWSADKPVISKNTDRIYYEMKFGYKATKSLNYSAQFNFRSQFSNSYNYPVPKVDEGQTATHKDWVAARDLKSGFLSPAYTNIALGIDWVPTKWLTVNVAPLTGGIVTATDEALRKAYGMQRKKQYANEEENPYTEVKDGETVVHGEYLRPARFEFGAQIKIDGRLKVNDNFSYTTQLVLFSNYLDHPQNIRVNWDNRIDWKLAKYFSLTLTTNLIYDDKVKIKAEKWAEKYPDGKQAVQFKEVLAFGFSYTIASKKK